MANRATGIRRPIIALIAALALALISPLGALGGAGSSPDPGGTAAGASARFTLDLSRRGDFVAQASFVQCVGASMQMMLNMIESKDDRSMRTQRELQVLARSLSGRRPDGIQRKGASVRGWTAGLMVMGAGPYRTIGTKGLQAALKAAARAIRDTGRPVGLLVWRGRHAWVMAGFTATADPRRTDDFKVLTAIVLDPLYPYGSKVWGASPRPGEALTVQDLGRQFVPRRSRSSIQATGGSGGVGSDAVSAWSQGLNAKYVIVMPYTPLRTARIHNARR